MKADIHPKDYRLVVFKDMSNDYMFMCRSAAKTKDTIVWEDGKEYRVLRTRSLPVRLNLSTPQDVLTSS